MVAYVRAARETCVVHSHRRFYDRQPCKPLDLVTSHLVSILSQLLQPNVMSPDIQTTKVFEEHGAQVMHRRVQLLVQIGGVGWRRLTRKK